MHAVIYICACSDMRAVIYNYTRYLTRLVVEVPEVHVVEVQEV